MNQVNTTSTLAYNQLFLPVDVTVTGSGNNTSLNFTYEYQGTTYEKTPSFSVNAYQSTLNPNNTAPLVILFKMATAGYTFTSPNIAPNSTGTFLLLTLMSPTEVVVLDPASTNDGTCTFNLNYQQTSSGESYSQDPQVTNDPSVDPPVCAQHE